MPTKKTTSAPEKKKAASSEKAAVDAYGGDPLAPNDVMLERIAAFIAEGEDDDMVERWATALQAVCPDPNTPKRQFLAKVAGVVQGDEPDEEVTAWAEGKGTKQVKSEFSLDHLGT